MINKVALGAAGLASTGTVGVGVYYSGILSTKKVSISSLVKKDDYIFVMSDGDASWDSKWNLYENSSNSFEIRDASKSLLKGKCSDLFGKGEVLDEKDKIYIDFLKFCTRDKTTKEKLFSLGKSILSKDGQNSTWTERFGKYKLDSNNHKFSHFTVAQGDVDGTSFSKLSDGCNSLNEKAWKEGEFLILERWCLSETK